MNELGKVDVNLLSNSFFLYIVEEAHHDKIIFAGNMICAGDG